VTNHEAKDQAGRLGLSAWMVEAVAVGSESQTVTLKRVGFEQLEMVMGEGETWDEAFRQALRTIFSA
jgi:hypothetical protein